MKTLIALSLLFLAACGSETSATSPAPVAAVMQQETPADVLQCSVPIGGLVLEVTAPATSFPAYPADCFGAARFDTARGVWTCAVMSVNPLNGRKVITVDAATSIKIIQIAPEDLTLVISPDIATLIKG